MPDAQITDNFSTTISPDGTEQIKLYGLDGTAPVGVSTAFVQSDEAVILGDAHAIATMATQQFETGGFTEEDMTVHSPPTVFNGANFTTPGLGITTQSLLTSAHMQFITATAPNTLIVSGSSNDVLVGQSGTNILDGGAGANTYFGGSGANTFIADARTANASELIGNMKAGDNVIVAGDFTSLFEGVTASGIDFQLTGATGAPIAEVTLAGATSTAGLTVGFDHGNGTGVPFFFIHQSAVAVGA